MKKSISAFILGMMLMSASQSSHALFGNAGIGDSWWQSSSAYQNNIDANRRYYRELQEKRGGSSTKKTSKATSSKTTSTKTTTQSKKTSNAYRYSHSASVTKQVNDEMIQALRTQVQRSGAMTPQIEQEITRLKGVDLIGQVRGALRSDGYDTSSVATAMAYYLVINYGVATQQNLATLKAHTFVKQLEASMGEDSSLANMSNADKQRMADMLYWGGSLMMAKYLEAQRTGNRTQMGVITREASYTLSQMGLSTSQLKNGANGLELR